MFSLSIVIVIYITSMEHDYSSYGNQIVFDIEHVLKVRKKPKIFMQNLMFFWGAGKQLNETPSATNIYKTGPCPDRMHP